MFWKNTALLSTLLFFSNIVLADSFSELSNGEKTIARSLMDAQTISDDGSVDPWTLDEIAASRSDTGWGNVFKQMQEEGVIGAKNLGEVVSGYVKSTNTPLDRETAIAAGIPDAATPEADNENANRTVSSPSDEQGAFASLSEGNKQIARAIMDAQVVQGNQDNPWTLNQIAAAKDDAGWGQVYQGMYNDGLVEQPNLGLAISQYKSGITTGAPTNMPNSSTTMNNAAANNSAAIDNQSAANRTTSPNVNRAAVSNQVTTAGNSAMSTGGQATAAAGSSNGNTATAASNATTSAVNASSASNSSAAGAISSGQAKGNAYGLGKK